MLKSMKKTHKTIHKIVTVRNIVDFFMPQILLRILMLLTWQIDFIQRRNKLAPTIGSTIRPYSSFFFLAIFVFSADCVSLTFEVCSLSVFCSTSAVVASPLVWP